MGVWSRLRERQRREFDLRCFRLRRRGYSWGFIAAAQGCTPEEAQGAVRRVLSGRYGEACDGLPR